MLVLSRKLYEKILIGPEIMVQVVEIRGDRIRLGIVAPADMPVHREEVWSRVPEYRCGMVSCGKLFRSNAPATVKGVAICPLCAPQQMLGTAPAPKVES